jgi:hypothetical protein
MDTWRARHGAADVLLTRRGKEVSMNITRREGTLLIAYQLHCASDARTAGSRPDERSGRARQFAGAAHPQHRPRRRHRGFGGTAGPAPFSDHRRSRRDR